MDNVRRWVIVVILALAFVGFVAYARGRTHHRGPQQVGSMAYRTPNGSSAQQLTDV